MIMSSCKDIYDAGGTTSGIYTLDLQDGGKEIRVFCDMTLHGGGWIVIQRRIDNSLHFNKSMLSYKVGFGFLEGNFWLGLEKIHRITSSQPYELYIGMESFLDYPGDIGCAKYGTFYIKGAKDNYRLETIGDYDSSLCKLQGIGDSLRYHRGEDFSARDADNDSNGEVHCARKFGAGWWYNKCYQSQLNGYYYADGVVPEGKEKGIGIVWDSWIGASRSMKTVVMAIRPTT